VPRVHGGPCWTSAVAQPVYGQYVLHATRWRPPSPHGGLALPCLQGNGYLRAVVTLLTGGTLTSANVTTNAPARLTPPPSGPVVLAVDAPWQSPDGPQSMWDVYVSLTAQGPSNVYYYNNITVGPTGNSAQHVLPR
jgi:hypothetical protein